MIINDHKKIASAIVQHHLKPQTGEMKLDVHSEAEHDDDQEGLEAIAQEIMDSFHNKDVKALARSLHDFFEMADSMPHKEGEHEDDEEESEMPSLLGPR